MLMLFRALSTVLLPKMVVPLHGRSIAAQDGGSFAWEIVLVEVYGGKGNTHVGGILSRIFFMDRKRDGCLRQGRAVAKGWGMGFLLVFFPEDDSVIKRRISFVLILLLEIHHENPQLQHLHQGAIHHLHLRLDRLYHPPPLQPPHPTSLPPRDGYHRNLRLASSVPHPRPPNPPAIPCSPPLGLKRVEEQFVEIILLCAMNVIGYIRIIMDNKQLMSASDYAFSFAPALTGFHFAVIALIGLVSNATGYSASKDELEPHAKLNWILSNFKAEHDSSGMIVAVAGMIIYRWAVEIEKHANVKTMSNVKNSLTKEEIRLLKNGIKKTLMKGY
ncbi:UDP-rhamnose/UDP-galactose transporter 3 [Vitis vinifera]|uniref:UDP-rhamnose/UDP-galactose transporter 3 n=1 Tax=Vitis vinifera TaxID=29760 RepID=A0A438BQL8_VITVI|nr:UDP-rhamnose/UDP-galactose transporter 3 [Vitis vinifera]